MTKTSQLLEETKAVLEGRTTPGRVTEVVRNGKNGLQVTEIDPKAWQKKQAVAYDARVKNARAKLGLSQPKFAALLGIDVGTLRGWEHGRRTPTGAAKVLIEVAAHNPAAVLEAMQAR